MLSKDLSIDLPPPPRDPFYCSQPFGRYPLPAIKTIATSPVTSKATPFTHHLAAAHTPRPFLPLSTPWLIYIRMLFPRTPCLFLLRDSTSNRKTSLPKINICFSRSKVALVLFCTSTPPFLRRWLWYFSGPLRSEPCRTQRIAVDRTRLACQRRQCFWEMSCTCSGHDHPHDPEGLLCKLCTSFSCFRYE